MSEERTTPNWALIGIIAGAIATVTIVLIVIFSPLTRPGPELPTADLLTSKDALPTAVDTKAATIVQHSDGCFFLSINSTETFAVWPHAFIRTDTGITPASGATLPNGSSVKAALVMTDRDHVVEAADGTDGYLDRIIGKCAGDANAAVAIVQSISTP